MVHAIEDSLDGNGILVVVEESTKFCFGRGDEHIERLLTTWTAPF